MREWPDQILIQKDESADVVASMATTPIREWKRSLQAAGTPYDVHFYPHHFLANQSKNPSLEVLLSIRLTHAVSLLKDSVETDIDRLGGIPVLAGTRFSVAQILAELADDTTVSKLAKNFKLDAEMIRSFLRGIAIELDRPYLK